MVESILGMSKYDDKKVGSPIKSFRDNNIRLLRKNMGGVIA